MSSLTIKNINDQGVILHGYYPVSYSDGMPSKGNKQYTYLHDGARYWFMNEENKQRFEQNSQRYTPAFWWFCATAVSEWRTYDIDPTAYKIVDNKLYVYYRGILGDTLKQRNEDPEQRKQDAIKQREKGDIEVIKNLPLRKTLRIFFTKAPEPTYTPAEREKIQQTRI